MNEEMFNELIASACEVDAIIAGDKKPTRVFHFDEPPVKRPHNLQAFLSLIIPIKLGNPTFPDPLKLRLKDTIRRTLPAIPAC